MTIRYAMAIRLDRIEELPPGTGWSDAKGRQLSLDAVDLESLERKDRAELAQIAETLGAKPTSRTRKADIIGMILELVGADGLADDSAGGGVSGSNGSAASTAGSERRNGSASSAEHSAAPSTDVASAEDAEAAGPDAAGPEAAGPEAAGPEAAGPEAAGPEAAGPEAAGGTDATTAERPGSSGSQPQQQQRSDSHRQGGDGDGPESGNRRRRGRRRNRGGDRERTEDGPDQQWDGEPIEVDGHLDLRDEGFGFLRVKGYLPNRDDLYVSQKLVRQLGLRKGDHVSGAGRPATRNEKNGALLRIDTVNGIDPEQARRRPRFEDLTPLFPDSRLRLERADQPLDMTSRIIDLISPIGKGQRGLIVSPPKAGKTTVMKTIAQSIEHNNPEVHLMVLLVDERPEEVTDMRRCVRGEVLASTFDRPSDEHTKVAEMAIERAKRLVEDGQDVVIILDGITRLARAYNLAAPATGRIMSGGIDTGALYPPKKFFGAARNVEEGGSLTILATALVETGSKMDEVIFEEFKGTGNMELRLDRRASEKRIYPAIDVDASSTRHEELLFDRDQLQQVWKLRRVLSGLANEGNPGAGLELLIDRMKTFPNNDVFLAEIAKAPGVPG